MISILYVDDEESFLQLTKRSLERNGAITVDTAESAEIALQKLKSGRYDAVVSDYQMPGMNGIEFLTALRKEYPALPFIIFTGKGREEVVIEAFEKGASFYLQKGGEPKSQYAELVHKIQTAVSHRRADARAATLNRLYAVLSATDKAIVRIHDKTDLLAELCRMLVENGGFLMARAAMVNPEKNSIERVAAYGHTDADLDTATSTIDEADAGVGPTRTAFREGTYNICNDITHDPQMEPWREDALKRGYGAMAAFPFASGTPGAGVITLYASEPGFFDDDIVRLLDEMSQSITFALRTMIEAETRQEAERALRENEHKYRTLVENIPEKIFVKDTTLTYVSCNERYASDLGIVAETIAGKTDFDFYSRDLAEKYRADDRAVLETGVIRETEERYLPDGKEFWVSTIKTPLRDAAGNITGILGVFHDITERKLMEEDLRESEARVRSKLDSLLSPEGDIGTLDLSDIIDVQELQALMNNLTLLTGMATAILDIKGNVLVATGWQEICTRFHRVNPVTAQFCTESDLYLAKNMKKGEYVAYKCKNNLWDVVTPLYIGERHVGNIFTGQFFYDDEIVDESVFIAQADRYGFDREEYLSSFRKVPRFSREKVTILMDYLVRLTDIISKLSYSNLTLVRTFSERDALFTSLRKSEERLHLTMDATNDGIWDWNIPAGTAFFSSRWYTMIGYEPGELPGTYATWRSLLHPEDAGPAEEKIQSHIRHNDESYTVEFRMRTKQGDWKWILARGKVVERDAGGRPLRMVGTHTDITERKLVQEALQESERKYRNLYQYAQVGLFETSLKDGVVVACNERYATLAGYSSVEDAIGKDIVHLYANADDRKEIIRILHEQGHIDDHIVRFKNHLTERPFWAQFSARINRETDVAEGSIIDITESKLAENALKESEKRLRLALSIAHMGYWRYEVTTGVLRSYEGHGALFGVSTEGHKWTLAEVQPLIHPDDRAESETALRRTVAEGVLFDRTYRTVLPDGEIHWLHSVGQLYRDSSGTPEHVFGVTQDITERKQAELELLEAHRDLEKKVIERTRELSDANERLKELDRLKSMFIASMSHELRTPLNSIIGFTGIIVKGMTGEINPEQKKQLGMVQESARHLLALINDVIDISKIEAGKIEAGVSTFDLADVLREVNNTFGMAAADQGLVLNVEIPGPVLITSDERRIKQIILNLVSNGIKFTDEGRIDVTVQQKGAMVEVTVRDTGIGISEEDLAQLFRPFARVLTEGRLTEGTGLGLYLSKKIARFLGGDITAESELHKGSVFMFSFPVTYEKQEDT